MIMEVILLTGASGGLGYKLARSLLEQGYFSNEDSHLLEEIQILPF